MKTVLVVLSFMVAASAVEACTNITVSPADGSSIIGRSMEFGQDLHSQVVVFPRGQNIQSSAPNGQKGLAWTSKYGYIALNGFGMNFAIDGMNEKGLSYGALWMPGTEYQSVAPEESQKALSTSALGPWVLANFATVSELKEALQHVKIWGEPIPSLENQVPPAHIIVQDAEGAAVVIEFVKGEMKLYDNPLGILTNYPSFDWQLINLQNYVNIKPLNASTETIRGLQVTGTGQGSGWLGVPGDWTPPSRFIRAALFQQFAIKPKTADEGVTLVGHLLNTVDIPAGDVLEKGGATPVFDYTQWIVIKDLKNKQFYYRTYQDPALYKIDLGKLNLEAGSPALKQELSLQASYIDTTSKFTPQN